MRSMTALLALCLLLGGCGGHHQVPEAQPTQRPEAKTIVKPAEVTAPTAEIGGELVATLALGSVDSLIQQLAAYVQPHLPPPVANMAQPDALRAQLFKALHAEDLERSFDAGRPVLLAMADPKLYGTGALGPLLVALPLKDSQGLLDFLSRRAERHETTAWKEHIFAIGEEALRVRFDKEWAFIASHEKLVAGAAAALTPLAGQAKPATGRLELRVAQIVDRYARQLDGVIEKLERHAGSREGLQVGALERGVRWATYLRGIQTFTLSGRLEATDIRLRASVLPRPGLRGPFSTYLERLDPGEPWGASFVPKDSALAILSRTSEAAHDADLEGGLKMAKALLRGAIDDATIARWGDALRAAGKSFPGEVALGVWVTGDGGIGGGGAVRVKNAKVARAELSKLMKIVGGKDLGWLLKALPASLRRELEGFHVALQVRAGGLRLGKESADLYELVTRWPRPKSAEERRRLDEQRKALAKVLGPKLVVAFTATGETGLFALGKDHKKRMAELLATARGGGAGSGMDKLVRAHVGGRRTVAFAYSPLATVVEGGLRVADQLATVPTDVRDAITKMLPTGKDVPVAGSMHLDGQLLSWDVSISPDVIGMIARGALLMFMPRAAP